MTLSVGEGDGTAILQLRKWDPSQFQLDLSQYLEAFISPTKELLLLLSNESEVLLLPLKTGKYNSCTSPNKDTLKSLNFDGLKNPSSPLSCSPERAGSLHSSSCAIPPGNMPVYSSTSKQWPVICGVKSLAWGHFGDGYDQHVDTSFRELLVVSNDNDIIIHAFRDLCESTDVIRSSPESGTAHGSWVDWGCVNDSEVQEQFIANTHGSGAYNIKGINGNQYDETKDDESSHRSSRQKKWLRTFLTDLSTSIFDSDFVAHFPVKESFPCSAEVVSFSIYRCTLMFLEFLSHKNPPSDRRNQHGETMPMGHSTTSHQEPSSSDSLTSSDSPPDISRSGACPSYGFREINAPYKCSKVFASSSHRLLGLVLTCTDNALGKASEANARNASKALVIVVMVHLWGIQWVCSVDLKSSSQGPGLESEWADFQFSNSFLVGLTTLGLVCLWDAKSGESVAHLHATQLHGRYSGLQSITQDVSSPVIGTCNGVEQENVSLGREALSEGQIGSKRNFKRLVVSSSSMLLAAVDEHGIIYVISVEEYVSAKHGLKQPLPCSQDPVLGVLSGWKVAGTEIGTRKAHYGLFGDRDSGLPYFSRNVSVEGGIGKDGHLKGERKYSQAWRSHINSNLSGFALSQTTDCQLQPSKVSTPLRRVFLPIDGCSKNDSICFSPFGVTRLIRSSSKLENCKLVHTCLRVTSVLDERDLERGHQSLQVSSLRKETAIVGEAIGCCFQGSFYLLMRDGLFIYLPSLSLSSGVLPVESIMYWQPSTLTGNRCQNEYVLVKNGFKDLWSSWQVEVLDRIILYEGPEEADNICLENGWDLKIAQVRHMQLALHYTRSDEIERSLEMLADVNLAEEGILRLLFASVYQIFCKRGTDNEIATAKRFLSLAACFATKMVRKYGLLEYEKGNTVVSVDQDFGESQSHQTTLKSKTNNLRRLEEMAYFLETIRNIQCRLISKRSNLSQEKVDGTDVSDLVDADVSQDGSLLPGLTVETVSLSALDGVEVQNEGDMEFSAPDREGIYKKFGLVPAEVLGDGELVSNELSICVPEDRIERKKVIPSENPRDMISRWGADNFDLITVVRDALLTDRLPLAVLQIHLQHQKELDTGKELRDTFGEVRDAGRAIAYDLFLKGESGLAISTLQRLGEDIEFCLRQLLFGTVRRSIRSQIAEEMQRSGFLKLYELKTLESISLIERLYPSSSFLGTYVWRQEKHTEAVFSSTSLDGNRFQLNLNLLGNALIQCGDVDGVIFGSWRNINEDPVNPLANEDTVHAGYWVCAAAWSDAWDQRTVDRILLDQPSIMQIPMSWESQLAYHMSHNDWQEVSKLLDIIPTSSLLEGSLKINLEGSHSDANVVCDEKFMDHAKYVCSNKDLEPVHMDIPNVKVFRISVLDICSTWLIKLMEQKLAKKLIFLKDCWETTAEIIPLLVRSGLIISKSKFQTNTELPEALETFSDMHLSDISEKFHQNTRDALHKLVIHHCACYNLPNLLDLYLDHHKLAHDKDSLPSLLEAAEGCQWAKWLLFSRVKGCEYDSSFSNARSIFPQNMVQGSNLSVLEIDEIILTVDDMAEGGGEVAALATLMYAPLPIQKCLCYGSVSRQYSASFQCTLENLRRGLQEFPTLWRTLVAACFGRDEYDYYSSPSANNVFRRSAFTDYLVWRDTIFSSAGGDTSLVQMLPCWFSKSIRRMIKLFVQGPLGCQSLSGELPTDESLVNRGITSALNADDNTGFSAISWEAAIQRNIEELYPSLEENSFGIEHHLHRGRALAAFNHILGLRTLELKSAHSHRKTHGGSTLPQTNIQLDVQALLGPCTQNERSLISSVMPLGIMHFEDSALVASCAFLLELCGLYANMLWLDVAVLQRISCYYRSIDSNAQFEHGSPRGSAFHTVPREGDLTMSLARALADHYLQHENLDIFEQNDTPRYEPIKKPSRALMTVLRHLEKASLPLTDEGKTCGSWLSNGIGNGLELRAQQKAASQNWNIVSTFCKMHHLPPSTKYLAVLAKDNDWVGFLAEAQIERIPFDTIVQVADKEFSNPRLKMHILTVLKSMLSKKTNSTNSASTEEEDDFLYVESKDMNLAELFGLVAKCERQKSPGAALLSKAKDLRWSLLAMIASCFPDASPLSCLTVWLEISAARETPSIKVNDISSQLASGVGVAVEATNSLPTGSRALTFHYNRKNPKRRRQMEESIPDILKGFPFDMLDSHNPDGICVSQEITVEGDRKKDLGLQAKDFSDTDEGLAYLSNMVSILCEQHLFLPLLRAFEMFLPSCSLLPFVRFLQAFSHMRLSEASAHLLSFSARIKEEAYFVHVNPAKEEQTRAAWISSTAVKAADAMLATCPSPYEKRCLLKLLAGADFGDDGSAAANYRRLFWKTNLGEPLLRKDDDLVLGSEDMDDASLLMALEKNGHWEEGRNWAKQLETNGSPWELSVHHVTEMQAEAMVAEWKEFLWDVPEERAAIWSHCQTLFVRYAFPALQAGKFFLRHAEAVEKDIPTRELHELLLLSLQWLSGTITQSNPVYPLHMLREIETRIWLLAVESEAQYETEQEFSLPGSFQNPVGGNRIISKMDNHINAVATRSSERNGTWESSQLHSQHITLDANAPSSSATSTRTKRRAKTYQPLRRTLIDTVDRNTDADDSSSHPHSSNSDLSRNLLMHEENVNMEPAFFGWEERVQPAELERAVLSLLEFGQISAARQLQQKLSPEMVPSEFTIVDAALKLASISSGSNSEISTSMLDPDVVAVIESCDLLHSGNTIDPLQVLESLAMKCSEGCGRGLCIRIIAVLKAARLLRVPFSEAFDKRPIELLQLLSLNAQDSLEEARLLVQTHIMPPASIARILAESFLKGLLAAHRGGYMDSQKEEGPAPLLWRFSDFLKWAELCPSESEIGHALMRLVITSQEIPHACEVELLILSHHFYKSSSCLDGVDVLVTLAANRVESYVSEGDFSCLARLVTGVSNFHALNFILGILIENGQLELLLQKYSAADTATSTAEAVTGFRMAVLTSLKHFNPDDLDAVAMVYNHFDMKHETALLLESRSNLSLQQWYLRRNKDHLNEDLLESMHYLIEAAEVYSTIDAGQKTHGACARASLISLQIRIPDLSWLGLSETNARRALVEQSRFQEALIVAEAYGLNQPSEWPLFLWNQMTRPDLLEQFVAEFVAVLPLHPSTLLEVARFHRAEVAARGDQPPFSVWGSNTEFMKQLGRSFRSLLKRTRDLRLKVQLATIATGFADVIDACNKVLDKVPDNAGPLILRRGHGGAYLPLM